MDANYKNIYPDNDVCTPTAFNSMVFPISPISVKLLRNLNDLIFVSDSNFILSNFSNLNAYRLLDAFKED